MPLAVLPVMMALFRGQEVTRRIKESSLAEAARSGRPVRYLNSSKTDKKMLAEQIADRDGVEEGLICVLSCVEPCLSFEVRPNHESKRLEADEERCLIIFLSPHNEIAD